MSSTTSSKSPASITSVSAATYDGDYDGVSMLPKQLDDVSTYPLITQELLNRGYTDQQQKLGHSLPAQPTRVG